MRQRSKGMSLIETVYAAVLLGFIALFLLELYPSSFVAIKRGESTFTADNFASTIIEDLRSRNFANLTVGPGNAPVYAPKTWGTITYYAADEIYDLTADASGYTPSNLHIKAARVSISWYYKNMTHQVVHETYLHNITR